MRIAMIAPAWIPIPPEGYGGIERVIKLLVDELVDRGNQVTLFASGRCGTKAHQVTFLEDAPTPHIGETIYDAYHVGQAFREISRGGYDVVHDHSGFLGPSFAHLLSQPLVHTLHGPFIPETSMFYSAFRKSCYYVAISRSQRNSNPRLNYVGVVHNAVDIEEHRFCGEKGDYLVCVSRICEDKGAANAVRLALAAGCRLILAGKIEEGRDRQYYESRVLPYVDGENIIYVGEVSQEEKVRLVGGARAFLFPIQWREPFGLVMAEALACGTPVLATGLGAVPEVVTHGKTGFLASAPDGLGPFLDQVDRLNPEICRREAEKRFSPQAMADKYLKIYAKAVERHDAALRGKRLRPA